MPHHGQRTTNKEAVENLARQDDFGHPVVQQITTIQESQGYQRTNPERRRVFRNGSRLYLMYDDGFINNETSTYVDDIHLGTRLKPDPGDSMVLRGTDRLSYAVGFNSLLSMAFRTNDMDPGDVWMAGFGIPDIQNFNYSEGTWAGSEADGWIFYRTGDMDSDEVRLVQLRNGTIQDSSMADWIRPGRFWKRAELWTSWYAEGGGTLYESYTAVEEPPEPSRKVPHRTDLITSVANDLGPGPDVGAHRVFMACRQDSGNSGFTFDAGSFVQQVVNDYQPEFKDKGHPMIVTAENTTAGTYEVVGAIRLKRPLTPGNVVQVSITGLPTGTAEATVLVQAIDPGHTSLVDSDFTTPVEHNKLNSALGIVSDNTATGPDEDDAGTDIDGATLVGTATNPGGYQIGFSEVTASGQGSSLNQRDTTLDASRNLPTSDYGLVWIDANEAGDYRLAMRIAQNA